MNGNNSLQHKSIGNIIKIHYLRKNYTQHKPFNTLSLIKPIKYISIIISAIVATVYLLSMSLRLDTVQQKLASAITKEIETLLEVPTSIGGIRVIHLDEIILKEIVVRDLSGDTALYAENVTAHISPEKLLKNKIQINTLAIASPDIRINRETQQSPINIQFILDRLKQDNDDKEPKFTLRINQLLIYDGKFRYDIKDSPMTEENFDPSHIAVEDIDCNISMKKFLREELDLLVRSIKGKEKSGLELKKLNASIKADRRGIRLNGTKILLPNGSVLSDSISVSFGKSSPKGLKISGNIRSEKMAFSDFKPIIKTMPDGIPAISFDISNHSDSITSHTTISAKSVDNNIALRSTVTIENPYDNERRANIQLKQLELSKEGVSLLQSFIGADKLNIEEKVGNCTINGEAEITSEKLNGNLRVQTGNGSIATEIAYNTKGEFDITANGEEININNLIAINEPLMCSLQTKASGNLSKKSKNIKLTGSITDLESSKYAFAPIDISGEYNMVANKFTANIRTFDPALTAQMNMNYTNESEHRVVLSLDVDSIIPQKIGLNDKAGETFSFNFDGELTYKNKENNILNAKLQNFTHRNGEEKNCIRNLHFCDNQSEEQRLTMINSDFIDCSIIGKFDYSSIIGSLYKLAQTHIPSLFNDVHTTENDDCDYILKCEIKDSHFISNLLKLPITINSPSSISGICNDSKGIFTINSVFNEIDINNTKLRSIEFDSKSSSGVLTINSKIIKPDKSRSNDPAGDLHIDIGCKLFNDTILNTFSWGNKKTKKRSEGNVQFEAMLERDKNDMLYVKADVLPDSIMHNDSVWYISGSSIYGTLDKININGLYLYNNHQHLRIDGVVGKEKEDILSVSANNLEVSTILDLVRFRILKFNGNATGTAQATSLLSAPDVSGRFKVDSFKIDNGHVGDTDLHIGWRNSDKSIFLNAEIDNKAGKTSRVDGFLSQANDTIHLEIEADELNATFINKMVRSFMSDIEGTGSGKVYLLGKWREVDLKGSVALNCSARINPTHVRYTFHGDSLYFTSGKLSFYDAHVTDKRGNSGWLSGDVTHRNLGKWSCDLSARAENLLVYDTNNFDELPLYGTVYVTGNANLKAGSNGLFLKAEVRNEPNSRIVYNASESGGVRDNSFVTFIDSSKQMPGNDKNEEKDNTYKKIESSMNLDFLIDTNEGLQVKVYTNLKSDDYIDLYGNGAINAIYDEKDGFSLKGNMDLNRGTYKITVQDIFTKEFNITKGSTLLFNGNPYEANLDIKAKYLVPSASLSALTTETTNRKSVKVNCLMDITGTLASPVLNFDLELPEGSEEEKEMLASATSTPEQKNMQFIYLLGIGKFYTYDYNNPLATNTQSSTAVESLISNTLSGQLNNMLGQIIDNGNWNISGNFSTSERGWNSMEVEGMLEGRLLNDRLLINGNLGYRENPVANRNVIGDFELQWLLNRKGTISLRAYSKTNDRYFSKTNLTTQGAGIILRHDFNSWKWWKKEEKEEKEKKKNKKKKE